MTNGIETCFCWNLLELWDLLRQRRAVGVQAAVSYQQEATQSAMPRVSPLKAVLTGHVKTPLQTEAHGKHQLRKNWPLQQWWRADRCTPVPRKTHRIGFGPKHSMLCAVKAEHCFYR